MEFDLRDGFPLLTGKRMPWAGTVAELTWFLRGETNVNSLDPVCQSWWTPWADKWGNLGPIYGKQLRSQEQQTLVKRKTFDPYVPDDRWQYGDVDLDCPYLESLKATWRDMMRRCYETTNTSYPDYGAKGVHVSPEWCVFSNFQRDVKDIPNWSLKQTFPDNYSLDKDVLYGANRYSKETCIWASRSQQPEKNLHTHHGWSDFKYLSIDRDQHLQCLVVDQLATVVASLIHNPNSRRHAISLWNPSDLEKMALPCCHGAMIQFHVHEGYLDCQMYQRSCDMFIGVPVNIASYSLLTHIVAWMTGLKPGRFIWIGGDTHIYLNHEDQVKEYLSRTVRRSPTLVVAPDGKRTLDNWKFSDFDLRDYNPHPTIKASVAV
jgi:thymidylate synthase